jgi:hypothetical protein
LVRIYHLNDSLQLVLYGDNRSYWGSDGIESLLKLQRGGETLDIPADYRARYFGPLSPDDVRRKLGIAVP